MQGGLNEMIRRTLEEVAGPDKTTALPHRQPAGSFRIALLVLPEFELQKKTKATKSPFGKGEFRGI
jgi:hypothetical protein